MGITGIRWGLGIFLLVALLTGCSSLSKSGDPQPAFSLEKTPCFGRCPVYKLTVYNNGTATFKGVANIERRGTYTCLDCNSDQAEFILDEAKKMGFHKMEDRYDPGVKDLPETIITVYKGKKGKSVVNVMDAPEELKRLEFLMDSIYNKVTWGLEPHI
ncbi:hypothetical protein KFE98_14440 [bacterium SCSIO 12741]|nr:hypothetical protein KFE98_14440 [bacterium SCSIO 12741]